MSAPVMMMGGIVSSCLVCILVSAVLAITYNSWCKSINGACNWFPFLKKKEDSTPSPPPPPAPPQEPVNPPPSAPGIPAPGSPNNPNPTTPCKRTTCSDGFVAHCGCSCDNPWWNGSACVKKPADTPSNPSQPQPAPNGKTNCGSYLADKGCPCSKPRWNGSACVAKSTPAPPKINCRNQATTNTGFFTSCNGTGGKDREACIARNRTTCMQQPGAVWE